jgi:hypothetical protein
MDNGNSGLKDQFGVGDPNTLSNTPGQSGANKPPVGADKQAKEFRAAFEKELALINGHLQFTAVNADTTRHAALAARRDASFTAFQAALAKIDPKDTSKAKAAIDKVLADARALGAEAATLRAQAQKAKTDWDARQAKYEAAVHQVEALEAGQDTKAAALRALVDGIRKQVNQRQYALAASTLDTLLPKLELIHKAYLQQKEAKAKGEKPSSDLAAQKQTYEKLRLLVEPRIAAAAKKQYLNLTKQLEEIKKLQGQATAAAQADQYPQATQHMKEASTKTDAYVTASDKEVEPPIMGESQGTRADAMLKKLPEADQKAVKELMDATQSEAEKQYLLKGVAAGHTVAELKAFAKKVRGKDATWMRDNLSLTGSSTGTGVMQQWSHSCNATAAQAVRGQMDPLYALKLHEQNPKLDEADDKDGAKLNPKLAAEQKAKLESEYKGSVAASVGGQGVAAPRQGVGGAGRWADDLLNSQSDTTGISYSTQQDPPIADAMKSIDGGVGKGQPVPIVIGNSPTDYRHYVVVTGMTKGPPKQYTIHDPGTGKTVVRAEADFTGGKLDISGANQITAIENPSAKAPK